MSAMGTSQLFEGQVGEYVEHVRLAGRLQDGLRGEIRGLRILRLSNARRGPFEIVGCVTKFDARSEQQPIRPWLSERHADAARVDHARASDHAVELHVRVAADDERHVETVEER